MTSGPVHDPVPTSAARDAVYANYVALKGWKPFAYCADDAETYRGELGTDDLTGLTLLEIGFGGGGLLAWAMERGAQVAGSEINPDCLAEARERGIELLPPDLEPVVAGNEGRFDIIVAFDVFEHLGLDAVRRNLEHCARLLKPEGRLLLRFPNCQSPFGMLHQYGDITHKAHLSGDHLRQLAVGTALEVTAIRPAHRILGDTIARRIVRSIRYVMQDIVQVFIRFIYVYTAPLAPVITVELRRRRG